MKREELRQRLPKEIEGMEGKYLKVLFRKEDVDAGKLRFRLRQLGYREECIDLAFVVFAQRLANGESFGRSRIDMVSSRLAKELCTEVQRLNLLKEEETLAAFGKFSPKPGIFSQIWTFLNKPIILNRSKFERLEKMV